MSAGLFRRRQAAKAQAFVQCFRPTGGEQYFHRRDVQRTRERRPVTDRSVAAAVVILRPIKSIGRGKLVRTSATIVAGVAPRSSASR